MYMKERHKIEEAIKDVEMEEIADIESKNLQILNSFEETNAALEMIL